MKSTIFIEPPSSGFDLERWCKWVARNLFGPDVFLYDVYDQKGIDICWIMQGKYNVIQCAQRSNPVVTELIDKLEKDFSRAQTYFENQLNIFYFATTATIDCLSKKVKRADGEYVNLYDVALEIYSKTGIEVRIWPWNLLSDIVKESPFLLRHLLNWQEGGDIIDERFFKYESSLFDSQKDELYKKDFYGGKENVQWYGITKGWDASRKYINQIKDSIYSSFEKTPPVAVVIGGDGGSGKSILLRRIAYDLRDAFVIYWLGNSTDSFFNNEWQYDVKVHTQTKFIIIIEDWYRTIERSKNISAISNLLNELTKVSHARVVIGDRIDKRKKIYDDFRYSNSLFNLKNDENDQLLTTIVEHIPSWKKTLQNENINVLQSTLFVVLFILSYGDNVEDEDINERFLRIFISDFYILSGRQHPFWGGLANALYIYANLYKNWGIGLSMKSLVHLACHYGDCDAPTSYKNDVLSLHEDDILKKHINFLTVSSELEPRQILKFHHDTISEKGWAAITDVAKVEYNDSSIFKIIQLLEHIDPVDMAYMYWNLARQPGPLGYNAARLYLQLENPEIIQQAFLECIKKLKPEDIVKDAARKFLIKKDSHHKIGAFVECLTVIKDEPLSKEIAQNYLNKDLININPFIFKVCIDLLRGKYPLRDLVRTYLASETIHFNGEMMCICLRLVKNGKIAKSAARKYVSSENGYLHDKAFVLSLKHLKKEGKNPAIKFLNSNAAQVNSSSFWYCLELIQYHKKSRTTVKNFLKSPNSFVNHQAFCLSLKHYGNETFCKKAAIKLLSMQNPHLHAQVFCASLNLLKEEEFAKNKALEFLKMEYSFTFSQAFCLCTSIFQDLLEVQLLLQHCLENIDPKVNSDVYCCCFALIKDKEKSKNAARKFMLTGNPYLSPAICAVSLKIIGTEAYDSIIAFLNNYTRQTNWPLVFQSLKILSKVSPIEPFIDNLILKIIEEKSRMKYRDILKTSFFNSKNWCNATQYVIENWSTQNRNNIYCVLVSHFDRPEIVKNMCLSIIRNWQNEFSIFESKRYFHLSLANPVIIEDKTTKTEIINISLSMIDANTNRLIMLEADILSTLQSIVNEGKFPEWGNKLTFK
jgi:hypothetical protein